MSAGRLAARRPLTSAGRVRPYAQALALAGLVIIADRITKHYVRGSIGYDQTRHVIGNAVTLVHYRNTGVAFDFLSGGGAIVIVVTLAALAALVAFFVLRPSRRGLWICTGLLVGGAVGNLLDRLINGSVTDFIKFPVWPAFNVADIAITFGVLSLLWVLEGPGTRDRPARAR